jgi:hypothetical protein
MGDSKRRKLTDINYGKSKPLSPELLGGCQNLIAQKTMFVISDFLGTKNTVIQQEIIDDLQTDNKQAIRDAIRQPSIIDRSLRQQSEQIGCYHAVSGQFSNEIIGDGNNKNADILFDWLTPTMVEHLRKSSVNKRTNGEVVMQIIDYLITNCDPTYQFPVWYLGCPLSDKVIDLIFVVDKRNPSNRQFKTTVR